MASTTFVNYQTVIDAGWLNDVNSAVYSGTFQASTITPTNVTSSGAISGATVAGTTSVTTPIVKSGTSLTLQTNGTTTAVTIDTSQNVGVGVTPSAWGTYKAIEFAAGSAVWGGTGFSVLSENVYYNGTNYIYKQTAASAYLNITNGSHQFNIAPSGTAGNTITFTQAMTLDASGNLLINQTSATLGNSKSSYFVPGALVVSHSTSNSSGDNYVAFGYNGGTIGSISQSGTTGVLYNITSDRRLKTNIEPLANSGAIIDALLPRKFTWTSTNKEDLGFVTDEYQTVFPDAITGEPNATKEEEYEVTPAVKDEQGNITTPAVMGTRTVPVYQMGDFSTSAQIAVLVAEVQSLRARLKAANIA
jgi:hypothetical protein